MPKIRLYENTIDAIKKIANETGNTQSHIYQVACDEFISKYNRKKNSLIITL